MLKRILLINNLLLACLIGYSQIVTECPQNIGFEMGALTNWQAYTGFISATGRNSTGQRPAVIAVSPTPPVRGTHTLIRKGSGNDPYGGFSLDAPNGSDYVIQLGNDQNGRGAESISYTLNVPANIDAYSITFNYAVVLENPDHEFDEQPKFTARVIDVSTNTFTECGSFEFTAPGSGGSIPGFQRLPGTDSVLFKPWSPVMVNLSNYLGKTIRLEFTTNDCSRGRHFGYAYLDFNENCSLPVIGNVTCPENNAITLKMIPGLAEYKWFNAETLETLGTSANLTLSPVPPVGTKIGLELTPYLGLGCKQTLYTTITNIYMNISNPPPTCISADITSTLLTVGNSSDLIYSYWKDENTKIPVQDPKRVSIEGVYYVKGTSSSQCFLVLPVVVNIIKLQPISVVNPPTVTYPTRVDITKTFVPEDGLTYSYYIDAQATLKLKNPTEIRLPGTFYIKAINNEGCSVITPVTADILLPDFFIPNTFTPNGDGINDEFIIITNSPSSIKNLKIFNRWGNIVYETADINNYWNGLKDDKSVPVGVYYWVLEGDEKLKDFKKTGFVMVLR